MPFSASTSGSSPGVREETAERPPSTLDPAGAGASAATEQPALPPQGQQNQTLPRPPRTPIAAKVATLNLNPKDRLYQKKIIDEMVPLMAEVSYETFMKKMVVGGRNLTEKELKVVGDFTELCDYLDKSPKVEEKGMYPIIARTINRVLAVAGKGHPGQEFVFKDTSSHAESNENNTRPDGGIYPDSDLARAAWKVDDTKGPHVGRVSYGFVEVPFELKANPKGSAFHKQDFLHLSDDGKKSIKQVAMYAAETLLHQHRVFLYMVYISKDNARLLCWDRTGAVVSEDISLRSNAKAFLNFICRIFTMSPERRGHDTTARYATQDQINAFQSYTPTNEYTQKMVQDILDNQRLYPIYQVDCPVVGTSSQQDAGSKIFLIGKYRSGTHSPTGRATRGYVAYDVAESRLAFLKDSWRPDSRNVHAELETYARLRENDVQFVATAIAGGDVGRSNVQVTRSQEFIQDPQRPVRRIHHRVVVREVGKPLDAYENSFDMIEAVFQAIQGHSQAWGKARILHRDISNGNILIDTDGPDDELHAFLNDWDLCQYEQDFYEGATQNGRSGTWPFLSALLLQYPRKPHEVADDLESFVHVITWMAFRFHEHDDTKIACIDKQASMADIMAANQGNPVLSYKKYTFFDQEAIVNGFATGGITKRDVIKNGKPPVNLKSTIEGQTPLASLLNALYSLLQEHYAAVDLDLDALSLYKIPGLSFESQMRPPAPRAKRTKRTITNPSGSNDYGNNAETITTPVQRKPERVLDTHRHILGAFFEAGKLIDISTDFDDKTADQFLSLPQHDDKISNRPSGRPATTSVRQSKVSRSTRTPDLGVTSNNRPSPFSIPEHPARSYSVAPTAGNSIVQPPRSNVPGPASGSRNNRGGRRGALPEPSSRQTRAMTNVRGSSTADISAGGSRDPLPPNSQPQRVSQRMKGRTGIPGVSGGAGASTQSLQPGSQTQGSGRHTATRGGAGSSQQLSSGPGSQSQRQSPRKRKNASASNADEKHREKRPRGQ